MKYYTFHQNNSGGSWSGPRYVIVQATSARFANIIAQDHGVYFDGVEQGQDCDCCGDRWSQVDDSDASTGPEIYGQTPVERDDFILVEGGV